MNTDLQDNDVVVRYDAQSQKILFLVPNTNGDTNALKPFFLNFMTSDFETTSLLASEVGAALVAFLNVKYPGAFAVNTDSPNDIKSVSDDASFDHARILIGELGNASSEVDLEVIDGVLQMASEHGDQQATEYLKNTWSGLRAVFLRRFSRERRLNSSFDAP